MTLYCCITRKWAPKHARLFALRKVPINKGFLELLQNKHRQNNIMYIQIYVRIYEM